MSQISSPPVEADGIFRNVNSFRKSAKRHTFTLIAMLLIFVLGALTGKDLTISKQGSGDTWPYFVIISVTILIMSLLKERHFEKTAIHALSQIPNAFLGQTDEIVKTIEKHLSPSIRALDNHDKVLSEAANLIGHALEEIQDAHQYVCFIGSASLTQVPGSGNDEQDENNPATRYRSIIAQVNQRRMKVTRYISFLDDRDYARRSPQTRESYLLWLKKQVMQLEANTRYQLLNCPRAQQWGSSRSTLVTERGVLDIVGNGNTGVLLGGEEVASALLKGSDELFLHAFAKPEVYDHARLQRYIDRLEGVVLDASRVAPQESIDH